MGAYVNKKQIFWRVLPSFAQSCWVFNAVRWIINGKLKSTSLWLSSYLGHGHVGNSTESKTKEGARSVAWWRDRRKNSTGLHVHPDSLRPVFSSAKWASWCLSHWPITTASRKCPEWHLPSISRNEDKEQLLSSHSVSGPVPYLFHAISPSQQSRRWMLLFHCFTVEASKARRVKCYCLKPSSYKAPGESRQPGSQMIS